MTTPLPQRPQAVRISPDGLTVAALYDTTYQGAKWFAWTVRDDGTIHQLVLLDRADTEGWTELRWPE